MRRQPAAEKAAAAAGARFSSPGRPKPQADKSHCTNAGWRAREGRGLGFVLLRGKGAGGQQQITARLDKGGGPRPGWTRRARRSGRQGPGCTARRRPPPCGTCPRPSRGRPPARGQTPRAARRPGGRCPRWWQRRWSHPCARGSGAARWRGRGSYSLASSSPCPASAAASWADLPPGAAHRSATNRPGRTPSSAAGAAALGSCT